MDSFADFIAAIDSAPVPNDEEKQSNSGNAYCVIAWGTQSSRSPYTRPQSLMIISTPPCPYSIMPLLLTEANLLIFVAPSLSCYHSLFASCYHSFASLSLLPPPSSSSFITVYYASHPFPSCPRVETYLSTLNTFFDQCICWHIY
jgi:hypothetical protein